MPSSRPKFTTAGSKAAVLDFHLLGPGSVRKKLSLAAPSLDKMNAARPHRMSWENMRENIAAFATPPHDKAAFRAWTDPFLTAGAAYVARYKRFAKANVSLRRGKMPELIKKMEDSQNAFTAARAAFVAAPANAAAQKSFETQANSFHSNIRSLGPQVGVNASVQGFTHLNVEPSTAPGFDRQLTPQSRRLAHDLPVGLLHPIAVNTSGHLITVRGPAVDLKRLSPADRAAVQKHGTRVIPGYNPKHPFMGHSVNPDKA
jgi:hypothetical protein